MWWIKAYPFQAAPRWRTFAVVALVGASLTACASGAKPTGFAKNAVTPLDQYQLKVEQTPDRVALAPHSEGLSSAQQSALAGLAGRWRESGGGEMVVQAPAGGGEAAARMASATAGLLQSYGVDTVRIESYDGGTAVGAPVLASFTRYNLAVPDCRIGWNDVSATGSNRVTSHFGCAVTGNLAVMIADPRHVVEPAEMTPPDASRRATVLDNYRKGELTSSKKDDQASGLVSNVGKQ